MVVSVVYGELRRRRNLTLEHEATDRFTQTGLPQRVQLNRGQLGRVTQGFESRELTVVYSTLPPLE